MAPIDRILTEGEFAGWSEWIGEPFDQKAGPFYYRDGVEDRLVAAFRADRSHTNGLGLVHGGCLFSLADYSLFTIAVRRGGGDEIMTVSMSGEFIGAAREGDLVIAYPEIIKAGRSMVFARGLLKANEKPVLSFSGAMMRVKA